MHSFNVGSICVDPPVLLAPMEDVTSASFRLITKRIAQPGLMFTEFVSAMAIHYSAKKTIKKMIVHEAERPIGIQIFGSDVETMVEAANLSVEMGADIVDINMGCWVPKVCKTGAGAALLKDPKAAEKIVLGVVRSVSVPVTVKVRAGWHYDLYTAPDLARRFEQAGAKMLTLHARFAKQGFDGSADWKLIEDLRSAVSIPLIGNGDVRTSNDALRMFRETGCDGVMVGRAAIGNPWALRAITEAVRGLPASSPPSLDERVSTALEHARLAIDLEQRNSLDDKLDGELIAMRSLRGILPLYVKGEPGAAEIRNCITKVERLEELEQLLLNYASTRQRQSVPA
jgi:nifR3 family TIM-barrel protein